jgi:hypothetical protein
MKLSLEIEVEQVADLVLLLLNSGHGAAAISLAASLLQRCPETGVNAAVDLLSRTVATLGSRPAGGPAVLKELGEHTGRAAMFIDRAGAMLGGSGVVQAVGLVFGARCDRLLPMLRVATALAAAGNDEAVERLADCFDGGLDARSYLNSLALFREMPAETAGRMTPFHRALARRVVSHPDYQRKIGALTLRVDSDDAVEALVEATVAAGRDPRPWLDRQCTTGRWDLLLLLLQRMSASSLATPELQLREAEAREHLGDTEGAQRLESMAGEAIALRLGPSVRAPTLSTMMFRNLPMMSCIGELVRCALERAGDRLLRVHVAAASTGEEAFSLAMWLQAEALLDRVEFLVTDIDPAAVEQARRGLVSRRLTTRIPERFLAQLQAPDKEHFRIPPQIFERLEIRVLDLVGGSADAMPPADVMVLNNLTIHLSVEDRLRLVGTLGTRVRPGGFVVMGGDDLAPVVCALNRYGFRPVMAGARACHEGWTIQRRAWYRLPRPYWALPPYRQDEQIPERYASIFCRDAGDWDIATRAIERLSLLP